jgi:hypothetical protein
MSTLVIDAAIIEAGVSPVIQRMRAWDTTYTKSSMANLRLGAVAAGQSRIAGSCAYNHDGVVLPTSVVGGVPHHANTLWWRLSGIGACANGCCCSIVLIAARAMGNPDPIFRRVIIKGAFAPEMLLGDLAPGEYMRLVWFLIANEVTSVPRIATVNSIVPYTRSGSSMFTLMDATS